MGVWGRGVWAGSLLHKIQQNVTNILFWDIACVFKFLLIRKLERNFKLILGKGYKNASFYSHFIDNRFTERPPLSMLADFVIIFLKKNNYYPYQLTLPPPTPRPTLIHIWI